MTLRLGSSALHGRGVFAGRAFAAGELLERAPVIALSAADLAHVDRTPLYDYYFAWASDDDGALALGLGSMMNHAVHPNAAWRARLEEKVIEFFALRDVAEGEELTIHYGGAPGDAAPVWFQERR